MSHLVWNHTMIKVHRCIGRAGHKWCWAKNWLSKECIVCGYKVKGEVKK